MTGDEDGPRGCTAEELQEITELIDSIFRVGVDQRIAIDYPLVFHPSGTDLLRVLCVDGRVAAHVPVALRRLVAGQDELSVAMVAPTATHPGYRHRGYATRCLRDAHRAMQARGAVVAALWTEEATFPFYQHSDWEAVASQGPAYVLGASDRERFRASDVVVTKLDRSDAAQVDQVCRLHERERWRVHRPTEHGRALLSLPRTEVYVARDGDGMQGYLVAGSGKNKPGVIEACGEPAAVEQLIRYVLWSANDGDSIQFIPPPMPPDGTRSTFAEVMDAREAGERIALEQGLGVGYQMMRLMSLSGFCHAISGYLNDAAARGVAGEITLGCREDGDIVRMTLEDGSATVETAQPTDASLLTRRELVQVLFGTHPGADAPAFRDDTGITETLFPYRVPLWELDHC